jgi:DNA processing protein
MVLNAIPGIGPVTCRRLLEACGGEAERIFGMSRESLLAVDGVGPAAADALLGWRDIFAPEREFQKLARLEMSFTIPEDGEAYPELLREIYDPPPGLYATAGYAWGARCIGIVGSRRHTAYGEKMAYELARELAASGWCVVSGLARGIDTAAHKGALEAGGPTVGVLGCGPDIVYPPENLGLYREITASGAVLSEFCLGRKADKQTFPMRNRIISGMSRAIVVVESDLKGGSMITARFAGEQGRVVCAVPGRADLESSRGCHALIRDGAALVTCVDDILSEIGAITSGTTQGELALGESPAAAVARAAATGRKERLAAAGVTPGSVEEKILNALSGGMSLSLDALAKRTGIPVPALSASLLMMELNRLVSKTADSAYEAA